MKGRWKGPLALLFFLGFPFVGMLYFWWDAHGRLRQTAEPFARQALGDALGPQGGRKLEEMGTFEFRQARGWEPVELAKSKLGPYRGLKSLGAEKSWAGERGDMVWQFVSYRGVASFVRGDATVRIVVGRRTMAPEWRVEGFDLVPR